MIKEESDKTVRYWATRLLSLDVATEYNLRQKNEIDTEKNQLRKMIRTKREEKNGKQ